MELIFLSKGLAPRNNPACIMSGYSFLFRPFCLLSRNSICLGNKIITFSWNVIPYLFESRRFVARVSTDREVPVTNRNFHFRRRRSDSSGTARVSPRLNINVETTVRKNSVSKKRRHLPKVIQETTNNGNRKSRLALSSTFYKYEFHKDIYYSLEALGLTTPTNIQELVIPKLLEENNALNNRSVCIIGPTGGGKTLAYLLPLFHILYQKSTTACQIAPTTTLSDRVKTIDLNRHENLNSTRFSPRIVILCPSRELCNQIFNITRKFTKIKSVCLAAGGPISYIKEVRSLREGVDICVCTPQRLLLHIHKGYVGRKHVDHIILEESDTLCDSFYEDEVVRILAWMGRLTDTAPKPALYNNRINRDDRSGKNENEITHDSFNDRTAIDVETIWRNMRPGYSSKRSQRKRLRLLERVENELQRKEEQETDEFDKNDVINSRRRYKERIKSKLKDVLGVHKATASKSIGARPKQEDAANEGSIVLNSSNYWQWRNKRANRSGIGSFILKHDQTDAGVSIDDYPNLGIEKRKKRPNSTVRQKSLSYLSSPDRASDSFGQQTLRCWKLPQLILVAATKTGSLSDFIKRRLKGWNVVNSYKNNKMSSWGDKLDEQLDLRDASAASATAGQFASPDSVVNIVSQDAHMAVAGLQQVFVPIEYSSEKTGGKMAKLLEIIDEKMVSTAKTIIFCNTVDCCRAVEWSLKERGYSVCMLHGEMPFKKRRKSFNDFNSGVVSIMVSTNVASRGLDIPAIRHVVMYDFPYNLSDYLHRIGRTARGGDTGRVTTLFAKRNIPLVKVIKDASRNTLPLNFKRVGFASPNRNPPLSKAMRRMLALEESWFNIRLKKTSKLRIGGRLARKMRPSRRLGSKKSKAMQKSLHFREKAIRAVLDLRKRGVLKKNQSLPRFANQSIEASDAQSFCQMTKNRDGTLQIIAKRRAKPSERAISGDYEDPQATVPLASFQSYEEQSKTRVPKHHRNTHF